MNTKISGSDSAVVKANRKKGREALCHKLLALGGAQDQARARGCAYTFEDGSVVLQPLDVVVDNELPLATAAQIEASGKGK